MIRLIVFLMLIISSFHPAIAEDADVLPNLTDDQSVVVLNDNLQRMSAKLRTVSDSINAIYPIDLSLYGTTVDGVLPITAGGTGQSTSIAAMNSLLPNQSGNSGKYLTTDGSVYSWGTVTVVPNYSDGTTIESSAPTDRTTASASYAKVKEFSPLLRAGTITVFFTAIVSAGTGNARVYKNNVAVGTEQALNTGSLSFSESFSVAIGDVIQIYAKNNSGSNTTVEDFQIKALNPTVPNEIVGY